MSCGPHSPVALRQPVAAALGCLVDSQVSVDRIDVGDDGWVAFATSSCSAVPGGARPSAPDAFTFALGEVLLSADGDSSPDAVAALVAAASPELGRLLPPFALVHRAGTEAPILAAVDWIGLFQLYVWQGSGVAAISTSARALAVLAGGELDEEGLRIQAMVGWQVADTTLFSGVRAMPAASMASLDEGAVHVRGIRRAALVRLLGGEASLARRTRSTRWRPSCANGSTTTCPPIQTSCSNSRWPRLTDPARSRPGVSAPGSPCTDVGR